MFNVKSDLEKNKLTLLILKINLDAVNAKTNGGYPKMEFAK